MKNNNCNSTKESQCWEPCGDLGNSILNAKKSKFIIGDITAIKMNQAQFNYIAAKLNIKPERLEAVTDVIFNGLTATPAESKHGLCRGVIQRDVNRVNDLYNWAIKLKGIK